MGVEKFEEGVLYSKKIEGDNAYSIYYTKMLSPTLFDSVNIVEQTALNRAINNGTPSIYKDEIYYTTNSGTDEVYIESKFKDYTVDANGKNTLQIFVSKYLGDNNWADPDPISFSNLNYSFTTPFITKDGQSLYFSSTIPGGFGGYDIYVSKRKEDGTWGNPQNLGQNVNTSANDMYPSYYGNTIYFSSKTDSTKKADIYYAEYNDTWSTRKLIPSLNSDEEDFAIRFVDEYSGYFSSNRTSGGKNDRTYYFEDPVRGTKTIVSAVDKYTGEKLNQVTATLVKANGEQFNFNESESGILTVIVPNEESSFSVTKKGYKTTNKSISGTANITDLNNIILAPNYEGVVNNSSTNSSIEGTKVTAYIAGTNELVASTITNSDGNWGLALNKEQAYNFIVSKNGFESITKNNVNSNTSVASISISPITTKPPVATKEVASRFVYFDLNDARVRSEGRMRLEQAAYLAGKSPNRIIKIIGHTDASGGSSINLPLSENRAKNAEAYLLKLGVDKSKIAIVKGVGEQQLVNNCVNFNNCDDEDNAENRRVEVKIFE